MKPSKYNIVRKIGQGQYGQIYLANTQTNPQSLYALKKIDKRHADAQATLLPNLHHPNIVQLHQIIQEENKNVLVLEYASQGDLAGFVRRNYAEEYIPEKTLRSWILQLCLGLHYLHNQSHLIHRDIKTINVLVMDNGLLKLADFGLAKKMSSEEDFTRSSVGTPYYLSPETVSSNLFSRKSDVWGLGCLIYELCTGQKPFKGTAYGQIFNNIVNGVTGEIPECYSRWLGEFVRALLEKNAEKRPTVQALLEDEQLRKEFGKLKANYKQYQGLIYPQLNLPTTKYLDSQQRVCSLKLFNQSLKTAKKEKSIRLHMEQGWVQRKTKEKKIVERSKFVNMSLRNLLEQQSKGKGVDSDMYK